MPDGVQIGITSTYSGTGVSAAVNDMQKLDAAASRAASNTIALQGAAQGWTKSQIAAAQASVTFNDKMAGLTASVNAGKMSLSDATVLARQYAKEQQNAAWQAMSFGDKYRTVSGIVNDGAKRFMTGVAQVGAIAVGLGYAGKQVYEFGKAGATIEYTSQKFDRLARSAGSTGDLFLTQLRGATRSTVSDFELLRQGSDLLQLGLAADTKEAVRLSSVMTALGMDTGELTLALANQSKRRLDQLGLSLSKFNEIEARLKDSGMNKADAFKEAFLQTAEQTVLLTGNRADSAMAPFLQLQAAGANVWDNLKQSTGQAIAPDVQNFANFFKAMAAVQNGEMAWGGNMFEIMSGAKPALISGQQNLAQLAMDQWRLNNTSTVRTSRTGFETVGPTGPAPSAADFLYEDAAVRRANATAYAGGAGDGSGAATVDYAAMLSGGLRISDFTEQYADKTAALNEKLAEENELLSELTDKYGEGSSKVAEQKEKISELERGYAELSESQSNAMQSMALGMIQSKDETGQMSLEFARASGLMTEDAYEAQLAVQQLTDAFANGQISAEDAAKGIGKVSEWASTLDGSRVSMTVDVYIRQHGSIPKGTAAAPMGLHDATNPNGPGRWTGGPLLDDKPTVVGDAPGGGWTPYTEVIWGDYVFNAKEARALKEAGLLEDAAYAAGGTAGQGPSRQGNRGRPRSGPSIPNGARRYRGVVHPASINASTNSSGDANTDTAADVASAALNVSQQAVTQSQATTNEIQQSSAQTVAAQQQAQAALVEKLDEVIVVLKRQPTKDDAYTAARAAQQTSI